MAYSKNRRLAEIVSDTSGNLSVEGIVVPTQSSSDNDTSAASTAFVHAHIDAVLDSAPGTLNTLNEIAAALNDDANFNTTVTNAIAAKAPLNGPTFTGTITGPHIVSTSNTATQFKNATDQDVQHKLETNAGSDFAIHRLIGSDGLDNKFIIGYGPNHGSTANHMALKNVHASGSIGFNTGVSSIERMHINSSGNVLIGTTSNNYNRGKFTVFGTPGNPATTGSNADNVAIRVATNTGNSQSFDIGMYNSGDYGAWLQASNSGSLDSHSPIVLNPNGGNVGIGTASINANAKLHVQGTGDSQILIYETGTSPYTATLKLASQSTTAYGANVQYTSGAEQLTIENFGRTISSTQAHGSIRFRTKVGNSSMQEVLHINGYTGNVGIGASSPSNKLSVSGIITSGNFTAAGVGGTPGDANTAEIGPGYINLARDDTADAKQLLFGKNGAVHSFIETTSNGLNIGGANVGIGTTTPLQKLVVSDGGGYGFEFSPNNSSKNHLLSYDRAQSVYRDIKISGSQIIFGYGQSGAHESYRIRTDGGIQFPDNNTFIATSNTAGGTAYEWGSIRRPAGADGGQLSIRQYSTGDTAANYPAYAGGTSGWDENTGMFFYGTDEVGLTAAGNPTFWVEEGKKWEVYENGFTSGDSHRGQRICLGGISHNPTTNPGGSGSGNYLHIKTNIPKSNVMFRFEYKGYSYNDQNMDTSMVGYTYTGVSYVYSPTIENAGDTDFNFKNPYYSSDTKLVLVLKVASNYTGGILWAQFVGSHCMAPGSTAIVSTAYSSSTTGAF